MRPSRRGVELEGTEEGVEDGVLAARVAVRAAAEVGLGARYFLAAPRAEATASARREEMRSHLALAVRSNMRKLM